MKLLHLALIVAVCVCVSSAFSYNFSRRRNRTARERTTSRPTEERTTTERRPTRERNPTREELDKLDDVLWWMKKERHDNDNFDGHDNNGDTNDGDGGDNTGDLDTTDNGHNSDDTNGGGNDGDDGSFGHNGGKNGRNSRRQNNRNTGTNRGRKNSRNSNGGTNGRNSRRNNGRNNGEDNGRNSGTNNGRNNRRRNNGRTNNRRNNNNNRGGSDRTDGGFYGEVDTGDRNNNGGNNNGGNNNNGNNNHAAATTTTAFDVCGDLVDRGSCSFYTHPLCLQRILNTCRPLPVLAEKICTQSELREREFNDEGLDYIKNVRQCTTNKLLPTVGTTDCDKVNKLITDGLTKTPGCLHQNNDFCTVVSDAGNCEALFHIFGLGHAGELQFELFETFQILILNCDPEAQQTFNINFSQKFLDNQPTTTVASTTMPAWMMNGGAGGD